MKWNDRPGGVHGQYFLKDGIWRRFQMDVLVHQVIGIPAIFSGNVQVYCPESCQMQMIWCGMIIHLKKLGWDVKKRGGEGWYARLFDKEACSTRRRLPRRRKPRSV